MFWEFNKYFLKYIFLNKTRQRLLALAIVSLFISAFALLVLQSTMGGLQNNLKIRSYAASGQAGLEFKNVDQIFVREVLAWLHSQGVVAVAEYQIELLAKHLGHIAPAIVHGIDLDTIDQNQFLNHAPLFIKELDKTGSLLGYLLARKMGIRPDSEIKLISPAHTSPMLGDVPRQVTTQVKDYISTQVQEVDEYHIWTRSNLIQNLIRERSLNLIRIFSQHDFKALEAKLMERFGKFNFKLFTWEDKNSTLVYALNLESYVMTFLFAAMSLLVAISITSGFFLFFEKIKIDLISFWILGASEKKLDRFCSWFTHIVAFLTTALGVIGGALFLWLLDHQYFDFITTIVPPALLRQFDIFVEDRIPVHWQFKYLLIAFGVPYLICSFFSFLTLKTFRHGRETYIKSIRSIG